MKRSSSEIGKEVGKVRGKMRKRNGGMDGKGE